MDPIQRHILRTVRLGLRPVAAEDASAIIAGVGQLAVSRYLTVVPHPYGPQDFVRFQGFARPGFHWTITDQQGFAGVISLDPGFGFWIGPDKQGRGYATEAARAVLALHFLDPEAGPVSSGYFADNAASARVHRKLGFTQTHVEDAQCRALGQSRPLARQLLTRADWLAHGGAVATDLVLPPQAGQALA
jgi:RimJ/RimL family protein N-acetyltransferase